MTPAKLAAPALILALLAGCSRTGEIAEGGGITAVRSPCPRVAVPAATGDVTYFNPPSSREASAIDVTAVMSNVQSTCDDSGDQIRTSVTFEIRGLRADTGAARSVTVPYFLTMVRGGNTVVAKRVGNVTLNFAAGEARASAAGAATAEVARSAATLPEDVRKRLTQQRKAGEEEAAVDPLSDPTVRQSVLSASWEALVGIQLTQEQLRYNATR